MMDCGQARTRIPALVDKELGPLDAVEVEQHVAHCAECAAELRAQERLGSLVRQAAYFRASPELRHRIDVALNASSAATRPATGAPSVRADGRGRKPFTRAGWNMGPAIAGAAAVLLSVGLYLSTPTAEDRLAEDVLASHERALVATHATDVESSEAHTVKPWFNGKLDFSPPVHDLAGEGFPLVGGRVDYIGHRPVAALVYRRRQHLISLYIFPGPSRVSGQEADGREFQGFHLLRWAQNGFEFWAASDVQPEELQAFRRGVLAHADSP
ncbi:MAG: anti-sigma factor [Betaproteobacteria bacterium]